MRKIKLSFTCLLLAINFSTLFSFNRPDYNCFDIGMAKQSLVEFNLIAPHMPHAVNTNLEKGFSFVYNIPGFFSAFGQTNLYYTNSDGDSYFGGIGWMYLIAGFSKSLYSNKKGRIYLNVNIGWMADQGYLGSIGSSYVKYLSDKSRIEFNLDAYFHHGEYSVGMNRVPYLQGVVLGINYYYRISEAVSINFGTGLSLIRYRYGTLSETECNLEYIDWLGSKEPYISNLKWDYHLIIPIGFTFSYHFK